MNPNERLQVPGQKFDQPAQIANSQEPSLADLATIYRVENPTLPLGESLELAEVTPDIVSNEQGPTLPVEPAPENNNLDDNSFVTGLSPEEQEEINSQFLKLKDIFETSNLSEEAKTFFLNSDVSAVIAGIKPMSYVQPQLEEKKWGFIKKSVGLSKTDLIALQRASEQLGILTLRNEQLEATRNETNNDMKNVALMLVINLHKTIDAMRTSGTFTEDEISEFIQDPIASQYKSNNNGKPDYIKNYRIGYQLGYPTSDVKEYIRSAELKNKPPFDLTDEEQEFLSSSVAARKGITVSGAYGGVTWVTSNPESPDTKQLQAKLQQAFAIQKSILNS